MQLITTSTRKNLFNIQRSRERWCWCWLLLFLEESQYLCQHYAGGLQKLREKTGTQHQNGRQCEKKKKASTPQKNPSTVTAICPLVARARSLDLRMLHHLHVENCVKFVHKPQTDASRASDCQIQG